MSDTGTQKEIKSILNSVKKLAGLDEGYEHFDHDIIVAINTTLSILTQLGVGPKGGFSIEDASTEWTDYISDLSKLEMVKTYISSKVKLIFDPPLSTTLLQALKDLIAELEWRLNEEVDPELEETIEEDAE